MRRLLLPLLLFLASVVPALAQDPAGPDDTVAPDPLVVLSETGGGELRSEVEAVLGEVADARDAIREGLEGPGGVEAQKRTLTTTLTALQDELQGYRAAYGGADDAPDPPAGEDVRARLQSLRQEVEAARTGAGVERTEGQLSRLHELFADARSWQAALDAQHSAWAARTRTGVDEAQLPDLEEALRQLRRHHETALSSLGDELALARAELNACRNLRTQIQGTRVDMIGLLRRENLLLRGRSEITLDALGQGVQDLTRLPAWGVSVAQRLGNAVSTGAHSGDIGRWAGATLLVLLLLLALRRRVRRRRRPPAELTSDVARAQDLGWRVAASALWAVVLAAPPLLAAGLIEGLPPSWREVLRVTGVAVGACWFARAVIRRLLPGEGDWSPVELDARSGMLVRTGLVALLWLTLLTVPVAVALAELGYTNTGAREAVWALYKILAVVIVVLFVLRRDALMGFLPSEATGLGRVLRRIVGLVHPVLILVGPLLLALDFLQYDVLAEFLLRLVGGVVIAGAAGFIAYGAVWKALSAWTRSVVSEPPDVTPDTSRVDAALSIGRYVLLLVVLLGSAIVLLLVKGGSADEFHAMLDVELPFQGQIEGKRITWFNVLAGLALVTLFLTAVPKVKLALERFVLPRTSLDSGLRYTISTLVGYVFAALGIYIALIQVFDLAALGYVFAALSVGIGFGLQEIVSNFVSGLILLFERPIKVGDLITVGTTEGWVTKINIRATTIQTRDNVTMLIPNKDFITQPVVNSVYGDEILRVRVNVGVAYGSDTALVEQLLLQAAREHPLVLNERRTEVAFRDFGASSLDFSLLCWIPEAAEHMRVASHLRFKIDQLFRENGVEIPFSQHDLHLRSVDEDAAAQLRGE